MLDFILRILELGAWPAVVAFLLYVAYLVLKFWMEKEKAKFDIFYEKKVRISQDVIQKNMGTGEGREGVCFLAGRN